MKLLGVLISFALVGNVLVTELDDYLQQVIDTNLAISQAKEFMPRVIKEMILNDEEYGMQEIAFMLSTADRIDFKLFRPENTNVAPVVRAPVVHHIPFVNLVPQEGSIQLFGAFVNPDPTPVINPDPEEELNQDEGGAHGPSRSQLPDLNLDPSTVPEEGTTIIDVEEKFKFQRMMILAILAVTDRQEYERIIESARKVQGGPAIKKEKIDKVLEKRRIDPKAVTNQRVMRTLSLDTLAKARREMTLEAIKSLIRENDPYLQNSYMMCRLVGAFRSIKYPSLFTIEVHVLDDGRCAVTDLTDDHITVYKYIGNQYCEVAGLDTDAQIKPFLSELE